MKRNVYLMAVLGLSACRPMEKTHLQAKLHPVSLPEDTSRKEKTFPENTYVVFRRDAVLYSDSSPNAYQAQTSLKKPEELLQKPYVMRLISEQGEFFEVATLPGQELYSLCFYSYQASRLQSLQLHFLVKKSEMIPVLQKPISFEGQDQTSIQLHEGIMALPTGTPGRYLLSDGDVRFEGEVDSALVGLWYSPRTPPFNARRYEHKSPVTTFLIGDKTLQKNSHPVGDLVESTAGKKMLLFGTNCSEYQAYLPSIEDKGPPFASVFGRDDMEMKIRYEIQEGTPLYWPNGKRAGRSYETITFDFQIPKEERTCFAVSLDSYYDIDEEEYQRLQKKSKEVPSFFEVCVGKKDVTERIYK
jgi:hypothetical protein